MSDVNLIAIFLTGLFAGALTCLAVQGGLLATTIAQREQEKFEDKARGGNVLPILSFLITKLIAYTILGGFLGYLGSFFTLSIQTQVILYIFVAIFMIGTALALLDVHPIFRYFIIQPPRFLTRMVRKESKSNSIFAPAILGAFTIFIPCGTTQAMMALSIASGNPMTGAAIMFAFVLGTIPLFFILGYSALKLGDIFQQKFMKIAAFAIIFLAIFNLNNALALAGISIRTPRFVSSVICTINPTCFSSDIAQTGSATVDNNPTITINDTGYEPSNLAVKAGSQVTLNIVNKGGGGCTQAFTLPEYNVQKIIPIGTSDKITFTAPNKPGSQIAFMCSMGMYRGTINVI